MRNADKLENAHYNLGREVDCSIKELAEIVSGIVGFEGEIEWDITKPDGSPRKLLDSSRFLNLRWKPAVDIEKGIKRTYE